MKITFGLQPQDIETIEYIIERYNRSFEYHFPDDPPTTMIYEKHIWEEIGKSIGWEPFTVCLHYFRYRDRDLHPVV